MNDFAAKVRDLIAAEYGQAPLASEERVLQEVKNILADRRVFLQQRDERIDPAELYYYGILRNARASGVDRTQALIKKFQELEKRATTGPCGRCADRKAVVLRTAETVRGTLKALEDLANLSDPSAPKEG